MDSGGMPFVVIPDTHGHLSHVEAMLEELEKRGLLNDHRLLFLGDYIDRGPKVRRLIDLCIELQRQGHVMLAGNHEFTLSQALFGEHRRDAWVDRWATKYESDTLRSYGIDRNDTEGHHDAAARLAAAIPPEHVAFLESLHWVYETPEFIAIHAGIDPDANWPERRALLAIRVDDSERGPAELFAHTLAGNRAHPADKCVVTGHVTRNQPYVAPDRVMLDRGVDRGGPLVAWVSDTAEIIRVDVA